MPLAAESRRAPPYRLGDFEATPRIIVLGAMALAIGCVSALLAWTLLRLIGFFTNVFFFRHIGTALRSPADASLGPWTVAIPVAGGLIIGLMARYGSERIRGHGIPEALEAILIGGSKMQPRVMVLKPLSSAISIGSGGPFGAEGPIIMTGGAFGSVVSQFFHLTSLERRTLLVAGAAAGMSATFATPVSAVLLAVELLLFEWKPRSVIPVALASAAAALVRHEILGSGPLFPVPAHASFIGWGGMLACVGVGVLAGALAAALTAGVYAAEDGFARLPIHWMWWPAIGGLAIGVGGVIFPEALGVGYGTIGDFLAGDNSMRLVAGVLLVKSTIWAVSLGSGTSGGVLAPLLMMGAALGGLEAHILPGEGAGFWPMVSMAAVLGGTMRCPFTAVVFALELTHDIGALTPLLVAVFVAYGFTVLVMRRSILTEKVSRRGYHLSREYTVDPLELARVRDLMRPAAVLSPEMTIAEARGAVTAAGEHARHRLYPVVDGDGRMVGIVRRSRLESLDHNGSKPDRDRVETLTESEVVVAYEGETARAVAYRMATSGHTRLPVLNDDGTRVAGIIALTDLLAARARAAEQERTRERVFRLGLSRPTAAAPD